jgi:hypothetical protein
MMTQNGGDDNKPVWISEHTQQTKHPLVRLHNEILDFCKYATPSQEEVALRLKAIGKYTTLLISPGSSSVQ